jgi:hypothetical protein
MLLLFHTRMEGAAKSGNRIGNSWWHAICAESALFYLSICRFIRPFV